MTAGWPAAQAWSCAASAWTSTPGTAWIAEAARPRWGGRSATVRRSRGRRSSTSRTSTRRRPSGSPSSRRSRTSGARGDGSERIFRRAYNYDERPVGSEVSESGLIFISFQADIERQFIPMQRRLDELDLLNEWTVPIGSAVFAIPPGCMEGGYIGETLLA